MDPAALRRLDRADTVVIDARLIGSGRWSLDRIETVAPDTDETACAVRVRSMLAPLEPMAPSTRGSWRLMPWARDEHAPRGSTSRARRLGGGGRRVLGLWRGNTLIAMASVAEDPLPQAKTLLAEARAIGLDPVLAGGNDTLAERLGGVARWTASHIGEESVAIRMRATSSCS